MESQAGTIDLYSRETTTPPVLALEWTNTRGVTVSAAECGAAPPGGGCTPRAAVDSTCDGVDDDCDGVIDDDFDVQDTTCGVGACARSGQASCIAGNVVDSCAPGSAAAYDATCDGIDDDCNGTADEDYAPATIQCGVGACAATGRTSCAAGHVIDDCAPRAPSGADDDCNGIDDDCDGNTDEGFVSTPTACASGACQSTGVTTCQAGVIGCTPQVILPVDDANPCTIDLCVSETGPRHTPVTPGTSCADADICNGAEVCNAAGLCVSSGPLQVDDGNPCTLDSCDSALGPQHRPAPAQTPCDDGNLCNGLALCDGTGTCRAGAPPVLDDGNPCTNDVCDPIAGVRHPPSPAGVSCADANACNGLETCDGAGACVAGTPPSVDDHKPCTLDFCDPVVGPMHQPGLITACDDDDACNGTAFCDSTGECVHDAPPLLDDGNPCTLDHCDPIYGVFHDLEAAGTECDDGNPCNGIARCDEYGACVPNTAPALDDTNPCTIDSCFPSSGVVHTLAAAGTACASPNPCLGSGTCNATGACVTEPPLLDDGNACTADSCDQVLGVRHLAIAIPPITGAMGGRELAVAISRSGRFVLGSTGREQRGGQQ